MLDKIDLKLHLGLISKNQNISDDTEELTFFYATF